MDINTSLSECSIKIVTGQAITDLDRAAMYQLAVNRAPNNVLEIEQALKVLEYLVIHSPEHPQKEAINKQYIQLLLKYNQPDQFAKIVVAHIFDRITLYAYKQVDILSIKISKEDLINCREKCWEELVFKMEGHLTEARENLLIDQLPKYAIAFGMYLSEKSITNTARVCEMSPPDIKTWFITRSWETLRKGLENAVVQIVRSAFDIDRRLEYIKVGHYSAPLVDLLGTEAIRRLKEDAAEMPTEKVIKLFNEVAAMHAKLTGEQKTADTQVNIGIASLYKQLDQIDVRQLPDVRPERKLLE